MTINQIFTRYKRPVIIAVCLILLVLISWFVFRRVKDIQYENTAERELLLKQRAQAEQALVTRDSLARHVEDSLLMRILGIETEVIIKIVERDRWIKIYLDTASIASKHKYLDSLFGPK